MFEDPRTPFEKELDKLQFMHSTLEATSGLELALMSLAISYKRHGLDSCSNDIISCAISVRRGSGVLASIFNDILEDIKNG